jgi:hypothetical protein
MQCNHFISLRKTSKLQINFLRQIGKCINSRGSHPVGGRYARFTRHYGQALISENSYEKVKESFKCERVGEVKLKNKAKPMVIYEVVE